MLGFSHSLNGVTVKKVLICILRGPGKGCELINTAQILCDTGMKKLYYAVCR